MTEVPPDVIAAIERIAAMPNTVERDGEAMPVVSSMVLRPAEARALLAALDSQKQSDVSPDGNRLSDGETAAWDYLHNRFTDPEMGYYATDRAYDADEMVDAFLAGLTKVTLNSAPNGRDAGRRARG